MKPSLYLETTIIGYLASWPSRDLVTAANQQITHDWWRERRQSYDLYISDFVIVECAAGDANAAKERAGFLGDIAQLGVTDEVEKLAEELLRQIPLPDKAALDASHIAVAAVHGM